MQIAVLGASGVAGRRFAAWAQAAGHSLVTQRADLFDRAALAAQFSGCEAVVNLATSIPKPGGRGSWAVNDRLRREGTLNVLAACSDCGVQRLVQQSVAMLHCMSDDRPQTELDPIMGYSVLASAADMEGLLRTSTLDARVVRGGLFYGPGTGREERWRDEVRQRTFRMPGDGKAWLSPVHVDDFARAMLVALEQGEAGQSYIACDDQPLLLAQIYAQAAEQAGVDPPAAGGPQALRSFRVCNARLRSLGWRPTHAVLRAVRFH
jgi:nucleoside-diphosphate-sugar epimerase